MVVSANVGWRAAKSAPSMSALGCLLRIACTAGLTSGVILRMKIL